MFAFIEENLGVILIICCIFEVIRLHAHFVKYAVNVISKALGTTMLKPALIPHWCDKVWCIGFIFYLLYMLLLYMGIKIALVFIVICIIENFIPSPKLYFIQLSNQIDETRDRIARNIAILPDPETMLEIDKQLLNAKTILEQMLSGKSTDCTNCEADNNIENKRWYLKIWHGDYSLPRAFWLNFLLVDAVFSFALGSFAGVLGLESVYMLPDSWLRICSFLSCLWTVFAGVGVCRSAKKYKGFVLWAYLACAFVVLCFAEVVIIIVKRVFA